MKARCCRRCAAPLRGQQMFYCSLRCTNLDKIIVRTRECPRCSKRLTRDQINDNGRFCSVVCANRSREYLLPDRDCPVCGTALQRKQIRKHMTFCSVECGREGGHPAPMRTAILDVLRANRHAWMTTSDLSIWVYGDDNAADSAATRGLIYHMRRDGYVIATRRATWGDRIQGMARGYRLISEPTAKTRGVAA